MNRIQLFVDDEIDRSLASVTREAETETARKRESDQSHCIFTPLHYERNYAYPLIVWLHGPNDDERQVNRVMPLISTRNYVGVAPRGTLPLAEPNAGYAWSQTKAQIVAAERRVVSAIAAARLWLNIEPSRIYLAGLGCGGTMALRLALNAPDSFAGVLSIGGAFPTALRPLGQLHAVRRLKIFLACGRDSTDYPEAEVCRNLRLFHTAGLSVCLRQYPCGDELTTNMLSDMDRWIMEQLAEPPAMPQDQPQPRAEGK